MKSTHLRLKILVAFCLGSAMAFHSAQGQEVAEWNVRDHLPLQDFAVQTHRGAGEIAEENTIESFLLGWKLNCIPEADVRTSKDGVIVAFHDSNFKRLVKDAPAEIVDRPVKDFTFDELRKLDVGSWKGPQFTGRRIPKLSEAFALMKEDRRRKLYLDIKDVDLEKLADEVREYGVETQVILASTHYPLIRQWKALVPESSTLHWMGGTEEQLEKRFAELRKTEFADITSLQIHAHPNLPIESIKRDTPNPFKLSDAFLIARGDELRQHGILYQTLPWRCFTQDIYWKLLDLGSMSFATDHPEVTWPAIQAYYAEKPEAN